VFNREPRELFGRVAAVTGAARGIGRATAGALSRAGMRVAVGDLDAELAEKAAGEIGGGAIGLALDVTDPGSFEAFLDAAEEALGPLDVLVNNAGILHLGPFVDEEGDATRRQVDVNLFGMMNGTRLILPRFRARGGGHLVNVASSAGKITPPGIATYTATKHAVVGLTESVRLEHRGQGIDFSIVMPGVVKTEMIAGYSRSPVVKEIEPEDVADAIVEALRTGRVDVWVPRSLGRINRVMQVVPRTAREWIARRLGADRITWEADQSARQEYEARAAKSDPELGDRGGQTSGLTP
jgi:NAD(P)-dependent dehydrogenase (short-subunit alcohol dehydrogenase family)